MTEEALQYIDKDDIASFINLIDQNHRSSEKADNNDEAYFERNIEGQGKIDEFALLVRIVKHERVNFLREIQYKQLFSTTQKDMLTGDSVLHLAVYAG